MAAMSTTTPTVPPMIHKTHRLADGRFAAAEGAATAAGGALFVWAGLTEGCEILSSVIDMAIPARFSRRSFFARRRELYHLPAWVHRGARMNRESQFSRRRRPE